MSKSSIHSDKECGLGSQPAWAQSCALLLSSYVISGQNFSTSAPLTLGAVHFLLLLREVVLCIVRCLTMPLGSTAPLPSATTEMSSNFATCSLRATLPHLKNHHLPQIAKALGAQFLCVTWRVAPKGAVGRAPQIPLSAA